MKFFSRRPAHAYIFVMKFFAYIFVMKFFSRRPAYREALLKEARTQAEKQRRIVESHARAGPQELRCYTSLVWRCIQGLRCYRS